MGSGWRPSKTWGWSGCSPKRTPGPALGDGVVPLERAVHRGGSYFQHQMSALRGPAHLLLSVHSAVQQPLSMVSIVMAGPRVQRPRAGSGPPSTSYGPRFHKDVDADLCRHDASAAATGQYLGPLVLQAVFSPQV